MNGTGGNQWIFKYYVYCKGNSRIILYRFYNDTFKIVNKKNRFLNVYVLIIL